MSLYCWDTIYNDGVSLVAIFFIIMWLSLGVIIIIDVW